MTGERHLRAVGGPGEEAFGGSGAPDAAPSARQRRELRRAKRAALWVGLVLPLAVTVAAAALLLAWLPRLPDPMASHWSGTGAPDGFMSPSANTVAFVSLGAGMSLLLGLLAVLGGGRATNPVWSGMNRFLAAVSLGIATLIMVAAVLTARIQLDLADARDAPGVGGAMAVAFGAALAAGAAGFLAQPRLRIESSRRASARTLALGPDERAMWVAEIRPSRTFGWVLGTTLVLCGSTAVLLAVVGAPAWWPTAVLFLLVAAMSAVCAWFRVRIDPEGLEARSLVGWPSFRVPAGDVERVEVREVSPFAEWGGWGLRWVPGTGFGIVMRTGEGIVITRRDGRTFAVTVDDAETGAALLSAVAARSARTEERDV
ncbi:DUF1648 domain-containing protein [Leucobacter sp.]